MDLICKDTTLRIDSIQDALAALGVNAQSLANRDKNALDGHGYVVLDGILSTDRLNELRQVFDSALPRNVSPEETGTRHVSDLHRRESCLRLCADPRILAAAFHILQRSFVCAIPHGREPLPEFGQQGLHVDWSTPSHGNVFYVATGICLLDNFTPDNGATRVVPGSHHLRFAANKRISDPAFLHPQQVIVTAPAGSVLFFNGHLLHSGTRNSSKLRRRTIQFSFTASEVRRWIADESHSIATRDPAIRYILGYG